MRESRFFDKSTFDFPEDILEAGSTNEADTLGEWSRWELVEKIQELDAEVASLQGSELSKQCKAKDKWVNKLLIEIEKLEGELL